VGKERERREYGWTLGDKEIFDPRPATTNELGQNPGTSTKRGKRTRGRGLGMRSGAGSGMCVGWRVHSSDAPGRWSKNNSKTRRQTDRLKKLDIQLSAVAALGRQPPDAALSN
jgi:hypothetical protein